MFLGLVRKMQEMFAAPQATKESTCKTRQKTRQKV